ncbi:MAG TPA: hypothetical protein VMF30_03370, partial [Pirellulales bacterium]|nr:hypothetical protein [Pirellulales bacterium]
MPDGSERLEPLAGGWKRLGIVAVGIALAVGLPLAMGAGLASAGDEPARDLMPEKGAGKTTGADSRKEVADSREISMLVRQLGDPLYAVRQRATKRLIEIGIITQPQLTRALDDDDAEVRSRAGQVLTHVVEADFQLRLDAFANDLEGRQQHTLPCWGRFSQQFGQDKVSRMLFVEMQMAEPAMLEALESNPKLAAELFSMRTQSIHQSLQFPMQNGTGQPAIALGTMCSLLLVSTADGVTVNDQDAEKLLNLIQRPAFERNLAGNVDSEILKKMLGEWIVHNNSPALAHPNFYLAFKHDLKEGLDLAIKVLRSEGVGQLQAMVRQDALLAVGRFGNHEHIALV